MLRGVDDARARLRSRWRKTPTARVGRTATPCSPTRSQAGDVVVLHDPIAAALAPTDQGARRPRNLEDVDWAMGEPTLQRRGGFCTARALSLDAYVTAWRSGPTRHDGRVPAIAAYIAAAGVVSAKEVDANARIRTTRRSVGRPSSRTSYATIAPSASEAPSTHGRRSPPAERPAPRSGSRRPCGPGATRPRSSPAWWGFAIVSRTRLKPNTQMSGRRR